MSKRLLASILGFLVLTALGLWPATVAAQTTTGQSITVNTGSQATELVDKNGNPATHTYTPANPFWVNLSECQADWSYQISVTGAGIASQPFEVWAGASGTDCTQAIYRAGTSAVCWRVYYNGAIPDGTFNITIPVQNVVAQRPNTNPNSTLGSGTDVYQGTTADCITGAAIVPETGASLQLNFYVFGAGSNAGVPTVTATWTGPGYDGTGPLAPLGITASAADTQLYMGWLQVTETDLAGYRIYCVPSDADAGTNLLATPFSDAGADAGFDADAGTSQCPSALVPGALPVQITTPLILAGSASDKLAVSGVASGLNDGTLYACAVSSYNVMQNDGPLSDVMCATPWYVNDFFSSYRRLGGQAGGGFCSVSRNRSAIALIIPLASLVLLALRRRRRGP